MALYWSTRRGILGILSDALITKLSRWQQLPAELASRVRELPGRHVSFLRGDQPLGGLNQDSCSLLMLEGWAARYKDTASGKRIIVEFLLPGDLKLAETQRDSSLGTVMLSSGEGLLVGQEKMAELLQDPALKDGFSWCQKVRASIGVEWLVNISSRRAYPRLAHLLCELSIRMNTAGLLFDGRGKMPLTQADLASALGMTNVHLNIALGQLRREKVLEIRDRELSIINQQKLSTIAEFDDSYLLRWPTMLPDRRNSMVTHEKERRSRVFQ